MKFGCIMNGSELDMEKPGIFRAMSICFDFT